MSFRLKEAMFKVRCREPGCSFYSEFVVRENIMGATEADVDSEAQKIARNLGYIKHDALFGRMHQLSNPEVVKVSASYDHLGTGTEAPSSAAPQRPPWVPQQATPVAPPPQPAPSAAPVVRREPSPPKPAAPVVKKAAPAKKKAAPVKKKKAAAKKKAPAKKKTAAKKKPAAKKKASAKKRPAAKRSAAKKRPLAKKKAPARKKPAAKKRRR